MTVGTLLLVIVGLVVVLDLSMVVVVWKMHGIVRSIERIVREKV